MLKSSIALLFAVVIMCTGCNTDTLRYLNCVIDHESRSQPDPSVAENPHSSASGLYQFTDGTWRSQSKRYGVEGYSRASEAPGHVQTYVAYQTVEGGGKSAWNGTGC